MFQTKKVDIILLKSACFFILFLLEIKCYALETTHFYLIVQTTILDVFGLTDYNSNI